MSKRTRDALYALALAPDSSFPTTTAAALTRADEDRVVAAALAILASRLKAPGAPLTSPDAVRAYLTLQLREQPAECFAIMFLDNRHRVLSYEVLFHGTIDGASVYPREIVRACIKHNAAAVILSHNHPSGVEEPSRADLAITRRVSDALALIDVRVLDHLIVGDTVTSFAERGLL